jgi:hypothetical protein
MLDAGADAAQEIGAFIVELRLVVRQQQFAEPVDGEDRGLQVVRQNAEEPRQLLCGDRLLGSLFMVGNGFDGTPPAVPSRAMSTPWNSARFSKDGDVPLSDDFRRSTLMKHEAAPGRNADSHLHIRQGHQPPQSCVAGRVEPGLNDHTVQPPERRQLRC